MIMDELDIFAGWSVVDILLTYLYSWRLDHNDPIPKGKKMELSLREKEKQQEQDNNKENNLSQQIV